LAAPLTPPHGTLVSHGTPVGKRWHKQQALESAKRMQALVLFVDKFVN